jgi:hypothetical protein
MPETISLCLSCCLLSGSGRPSKSTAWIPARVHRWLTNTVKHWSIVTPSGRVVISVVNAMSSGARGILTPIATHGITRWVTWGHILRHTHTHTLSGTYRYTPQVWSQLSPAMISKLLEFNKADVTVTLPSSSTRQSSPHTHSHQCDDTNTQSTSCSSITFFLSSSHCSLFYRCILN